jgi:general secretion pathway protein C
MKRYLIVLDVCLILLAAYLVVQAGYRMAALGLPPQTTDPRSNQSLQAPVSSAIQSLGTYDAIVTRNLFGNPQAPADQPAGSFDLSRLENTTLALKLWGTVSGRATGSYAVIEDEALRKQQLYQEGDRIQQALIKSILREKVILSVNGQDQVLAMVKPESQPSARPAALTIAAVERGAQPPATAEPPALPAYTIDRGEFTSAMGRFSELTQQVKLRPYMDQGQPQGVVLETIDPTSIFTRIGLQSGDIITGINGIPIASVQDALNFYRRLSASSDVRLEILRSGQKETIDYRLE